MKKLLIAFSMLFVLAIASNSAKAQAPITLSDPQVTLAANNLINVQVPVNISNVQITDVIDVTNVLNGNDVRILTDFLNQLTIDNVLNDLLRQAELIKNNQVVVGVVLNVLGGVEQVLVARQGQLRNG